MARRSTRTDPVLPKDSRTDHGSSGRVLAIRILLLLLLVLAAPALAEGHVADKKRTILQHQDPSKETWNTLESKIRRSLKERAKVQDFGLNLDTPVGQLRLKPDLKGGFRVQLRGKY